MCPYLTANSIFQLKRSAWRRIFAGPQITQEHSESIKLIFRTTISLELFCRIAGMDDWVAGSRRLMFNISVSNNMDFVDPPRTESVIAPLLALDMIFR